MKLGLSRKFIIAFGVLTIIIVSNFGLLWMAEQNAEEQQKWVIHTQKIIHESESLLGHLRDAETGQRGFLLTSKPEYLEPYNSSISGTKNVFDRLKNLTQDNPKQQILLDSLNRDIKDKFQELNETIELARQNKHDAALQIVNSGIGKQYMEAMRKKIRMFKNEEYELLEIRQSRYEQEKSRMKILYIGEALLLISIIILNALAIQRKIVNPLVNLTSNTIRMMEGKSVNLPAKVSNDEIGILTKSFKEMSSKINSTLDELSLAKNEAEQKEQRLTEIIWSANVGTWQWDISDNVVLFNPRWAEMLGYSLQELNSISNNALKDRIHEDDVKTINVKLDSLISGEIDYFIFESRRQHKDGGWVWMLDRGKISEYSEDGKPLRISGTSTDISERKQADLAKAEFISTVSHELRTPLTSIKGSLGLLRSGILGEFHDKAKSMIEISYSNSDRLLLLINDILDIEKIEAGKMVLDIQPVEVNEMIEESIEVNRGYGEKHDVTFSYVRTLENIFVEGDKNRLMQVLLNLMSNAAKFSPPGDQVELYAHYDNDRIRIVVSDHGTGIPEKFHDTLFDKFTQADSSDTRKVGGTGLGLSISKEIIELHKGTIGFDTVVNQGTTFYFVLPIYNKKELEIRAS